MVMLDPALAHGGNSNTHTNNDPMRLRTASFDSIPAAFQAANDEDVCMTLNLLANPSRAKHDTKFFYMIPCAWMESTCEFLQGRSNRKPMNEINNASLLEVASETNHQQQQQWPKLQNWDTSSLKTPMSYGLDYYLIGPHTWTLLSGKFGFDVALPRPVVQQAHGGLVVQLSSLLSVPIPQNGRFECGMTIGYAMTFSQNQQPTSDIVSEEEDEEPNDLFPSLSENDAPYSSNSGAPYSSNAGAEPILMLPPSTTTTTSTGTNGVAQQPQKTFHAKGLGNLGNTCFMNSTLQCLAHTHPLRRYFLSGEYQDDLNRDNPLGAQGELATEFAHLLQQLWTSAGGRFSNNIYGASTVYPRSFKSTLGKHAEQFLGYDQHDSHELATYLLDALHEDTNRVTKKPYVEKPEQSEDEPDDVAAAKAWNAHLQREDSRVLEQFVGLVKSRVQCPVESCGRVSTTFDPFMYLSVPIPGATDRTLAITFVPLNPLERHKKLNVTLSKTASMLTLQKNIVTLLSSSSEYEGLEAHDVCLADVWSNEVYHFHKPKDEIDKIRDSDTTFAFQLRSVSSIHEEENAKSDQQEVDMSWDTGKQFYDCHGSKLAYSILQRFETDDDRDWTELLEPYVRHPTLFYNLFSPRKVRDRLHELIKFLHTLEGFVEALHKCPDSRTGHSSMQDESPMEVEASAESKEEKEDLSSFLSMEERCAQSRTFRNVRNTHHLAILECCTKKLRSFIIENLKGKAEENKDGNIIQVVFQRKPPPNKFVHQHNYYSTSMTTSSDKTFALPLALRIPPSMTVYELRQELTKRISRSVKALPVVEGPATPMEDPSPEQDATTEEEMSTATTVSVVDEEIADAASETAQKDAQESSMAASMPNHPQLSDLPIMDTIPLTYDNKSTEYSTYKASDKTLGMLAISHDGVKQFNYAYATHPDEGLKVCEMVAAGGTVYAHWSTEQSEEQFDVGEYEACEAWTPPVSEEDKRMATRSSTKKTITVFDCIERYCQMEQLEDSEMWYCSKCKEHVRAWKQFHLYRAPPILIIHLKRFHYSATTHRRDKIDSYVDFPLEGLDLTDEVTQWSEEEKPVYDLYAVSNHFGGLGGGHYTAYALSDDGEWCNFDDSRVTTNVDPEQVKSDAAYVLYYRRRDVAVDNGVEDLMTTTPESETRKAVPAIVQDHEPRAAFDNQIITTDQPNLSSSDDDLASHVSAYMDEDEAYYDPDDNDFRMEEGITDYPLQ